MFRRSQREFEDEIRAHLELETDQLIAEGHPPTEARQLARKRFGNVGVAQQRYYDASRLAWLHDVLTDCRYTLRMMRKRPGFAVSVMLIASLGLIACVTTFSLVSGILLKPFAFPRQDRVFMVDMRGSGIQTAALPIAVYDSLARAPEVAAIGASEPRGIVVRVGNELVRAGARVVTPSLFEVYGLTPAVGRFFLEGERDVAVLDNDEWRLSYGSDTSVVGRMLVVNGRPLRIVGVSPAGFSDHASKAAFWLPLEVNRSRPGYDVNAILRLADSVSPERASASLRRYHGLVENFSTGDSVAAAVGLLPISDLINGQVRQPLLILFAAVLLVLILVSANVATLFLAQVGSRRGELGVRRALGASRGRQLRQLATESMTLTAAGGLIGLAVSVFAIAYVKGIGLQVLPRIEEVGVDWRVALFAFGVVIATGLAGGGAQAFAAADASWMNETTRVASSRTSTILVIVQVALSVLLLVGAGLLVKGFMKVAPENPGFTTTNRATLELTFLGERERKSNPADAIARVQRSLDAVAGVSEVSASTWLPLTGNVSITDVATDTPADQRLTAYEYLVSDNYFAVLGMAIRNGRRFTAADRAGSAPVAIINETAAKRWFGDANPIGSRLTIGRGADRQAVTVVGVVNDTRVSGRNTRLVSQLYLPITQGDAYTVTFVASTAIAPTRLMPALRRAATGAASQASINDASEIAAIVGRSVDRARFFSVALGLFAIAAVALSGLGVYGLLAFAVMQRRREIGIRLALGAAPGRIGRAIVGRAAGIAIAGAAAGLVASFALTRYMGSLLIEVTPRDPAAFLLAGMVAVFCAILAAAVPVVRATRIDPIETIRA